MATASPKNKFDAAVKVIHSLPKDGPFQPSREMMLLFYGYYKQATEGPCLSPKPSFWDLVKKAKWDAWNKLGEMDRDTAMLRYVDELKKTLKDCTQQWNDMSKNGDPRFQPMTLLAYILLHQSLLSKIVEAMPQTNEVGDFMEVLGSFYEIVDEEAPMKTASVPNGVPLDDGYNTEPSTDTSTEHGESCSPGDATLENGTEDEEPEESEEPVKLPEGLKPVEPVKLPEGLKPVEPVQREGSDVQSSDSEDEFCDTSADLEVLGIHRQEQVVQANGHVIQEQNVVPVKSVKANHVRFSDSVGNAVSHGEVKETIHVAQGFPFISSDNTNGHGDISFETSSLTNTALGTRNMNVSDISANNSNVVGVVDEGEEPPDGRDRGKDKNQKSSQGGRRSGSSRINLQGGGGRRALLPGGGSGGGAGGGEQGPAPGTSDAVNEQIAAVLVRLQQDMSSVLDRLNRLETQTRQRQREASEESFSWWPFANRAGRAAFFFLVWPIVVHLALSYFFRKRRKR